MSHPDYLPTRDQGRGFYVIYYGYMDGGVAAGPYESVEEMATDLKLYDYPEDGYVAWMDSEGRLSMVSQLNPDDLLPDPYEGDVWDDFDVVEHRAALIKAEPNPGCRKLLSSIFGIPLTD